MDSRWIIYILLFLIFFSLYVFYMSIQPKRYISDADPSDFNLSYENMTLVTEDGLKLDAWFIPADSKSAIIVAHGYPFDKGNVLPSSLYLHERHNLLFFDFRSMGKSEGSITTAGARERYDMLAAVAYLKSRGMENIGVIGYSLGAAVAIMTESDDIKVIVADSSYADMDTMIETIYRPFWIFKYPFVQLTKFYTRLFLGIDTRTVSPVNSIKGKKTPVLLIHGDRDSQIHHSNSLRLHEANTDAELWLVKGADHLQAHAVTGIEYEERVLSFFERLIPDEDSTESVDDAGSD